MKLETIKIRHKDGFALINRAEFDPKRHQPYETPKLEEKPEKASEESLSSAPAEQEKPQLPEKNPESTPAELKGRSRMKKGGSSTH